MRKIILGAGISLDGYVARTDGGIDFLGPVEGYTMSDLFDSLDAIAFGRKTFDEALKRGNGSYDAPMQMPTYVFSRSNPPGERDGVIFTNQTPSAFVAAMRQHQNGKNIFVMGGGELARSFLQDDVVDELHLGVYPVLLGSGIPFFPPNFPQRNFTLAESKTYPPDGFLELRYVRARE
jgi:dihydrofolate reductase